MSTHGMLAAARAWLLESGIRDTQGAFAELPGGLHRAYDAATGTYAPLYPEVTAYALQLHLGLWRKGGDVKDLEAAVQSGEWLLMVQGAAGSAVAGAFPYAVNRADTAGGWYTFDTAVVAHALVELGEETGNPTFSSAAERAAAWVLRHQRPDGSFAAFEGQASPVSWASDGNCLHGKLAILLGALWIRSRDSRYRKAADKLLGWVSTLQRPDGGIPTSPHADYIFLHSHCYAVEGLLVGATQLQQPSLLRAATRGANFLARQQQRTGALPRYLGPGALAYLKEVGARFPHLRQRWVPADVGATAQAVRIWSWLQRTAGVDFSSQIDVGLAWLERCQLRGPDHRVYGGFPAGIDRLLGWEWRELRLYPWVTVFVADALRSQAAAPPDARIF